MFIHILEVACAFAFREKPGKCAQRCVKPCAFLDTSGGWATLSQEGSGLGRRRGKSEWGVWKMWHVCEFSFIGHVLLTAPNHEPGFSSEQSISKYWSHLAKNVVRTPMRHLGNIGGDRILSWFLSPNSDSSCMDFFSSVNILWTETKYLPRGNLLTAQIVTVSYLPWPKEGNYWENNEGNQFLCWDF